MRPLALAAALLLAAPAAAQVEAPPTARERPGCYGEQMPELVGGLASLQPGYPKPAHRAGVQGRVFLQFVVGTDGSTSGVRVTRGLDPALDTAAVAALRHVRFEPGRRCGVPVPVRFSLPVNFRLADHRADVGRYPIADLPLHAGPDDRSPIVARIPLGTPLAGLSYHHGWVIVRYEGTAGYVPDAALAYAPPPGAPKRRL